MDEPPRQPVDDSGGLLDLVAVSTVPSREAQAMLATLRETGIRAQGLTGTLDAGRAQCTILVPQADVARTREILHSIANRGIPAGPSPAAGESTVDDTNGEGEGLSRRAVLTLAIAILAPLGFLLMLDRSQSHRDPLTRMLGPTLLLVAGAIIVGLIVTSDAGSDGAEDSDES